MENKKARLALLMAASMATLNCGNAQEEHAEQLATDSESITGGRLVPSTSHGPPDTSVVKLELMHDIGVTSCSGLKVGSNVFWTAGHCLTRLAPGHTVRMTNNLSGTFSGSSSYIRTLTSVDIHPSRKNFTNTQMLGVFPSHYDVGRFTVNDTTPNIPAYATVHTDWVGPNQSVTFTGYGCDNLDPSHSGQKQYDFFNLVDEATIQNGGFFVPGNEKNYYAHTMMAIGSDPASCGGDSGSPVFQKINSTWKVIGVTANGTGGLTLFSRYGNVRNWLAAPASNQFAHGFIGFIFNRYTGRCLGGAPSGSLIIDSACDGRLQNTDRQSWGMATTDVFAGLGLFYLINGNTGNCLDLETTNDQALLVQKPCQLTLTGTPTQRWRFTRSSNHADYWRLENGATGRCSAPDSPDHVTGQFVRSYPCSGVHPAWQHQAWMMTR